MTPFPCTPGTGVAQEAGEVPDTFAVTRTGSTLKPLTVDFDVNGSDDVGPYEVTDATGKILDGSVTIPAGSTYASVLITPLEDNTPRWTESIAMTLTASSDYTLGSTTTAQTDVVNDDLSLYLNNGSNNIILDGSSDGLSDPATLTLDFPAEQRDNATVTLVDNAPTEADVWLDSPSAGDTPIMGNVNGTTVSTYTWTEGSGSTPPKTLYVTAYNGSASIGDITFTESDSDANAEIPGSPPSPPPATQPSTENASTSQPSDSTYVEIDSLNNRNDNGTPAHLNVTGATRGWLLGQMADLQAVIIDPRHRFTVSTYQWSITGSDTVLRAIPGDGTSHRQAVDIGADDGGASDLPLPSGNKVHTGTSQQEFAFFWAASPDSGPDQEKIALTVTGIGAKPEAVSTTFSVTLPNVSQEQVLLGTPGFNADMTRLGIFNVNVANPKIGAVFKENVQMPSGFAGQGKWKFVQKISDGFHITAGGTGAHDPLNNIWVLDTADPYEGDEFDTGSGQQNANDTPSTSLVNGMTEALEKPYFKMFVEFQPPGLDSQWAVIRMADWTFYAQAIYKNNIWSLAGNPTVTPNPAFQNPTEVPQWQQVATDATAKVVPD